MKTRARLWTGGWKVLLVAVVTAVVGIGAVKSDAAGLLVADGGLGGVLEIVEHDVKVTINNGIAVTKVSQIFKNTEKRQVEALYTFPVPKGASVANFSMWINGKEMVGEVLEKKRAREIYNSYKKVKRDPGLLEQVDYKTFEMRIFPIAAGAEQKVEITYYQEMDFDHDWVNYVYPLATTTAEGVDSKTHGKFAITFEIKSEVPIKQVESSSHANDFIIAGHSESYFQASLETVGGELNRDVVLACEMKRPRSGMDMIISKEPGDDGYFCMTVTAGEDLGKLDSGMDYIFLIDVSGSMGNDRKLAMSKASVESFVESLSKDDRFDVMTFNIEPHIHFGSLKNATAENITGAINFMASQKARGGTVLDPAMSVAYKYADPDRTLNVVILSDGMTEQRERKVLLDRIKSRPRNARVFCIGVGNDVNRPLLQQMAQDSGGIAEFVSRGSNFKRLAEAFRRKLMHPAASDLDIRFDGVTVYDVEPKVLPNLYHGAPIRIYGRYKGDGKTKVKLNADIKGVALTMNQTFNFSSQNDDNPEIERMWAWKRVNELLKMADRTGSRDSVTSQIVSLGELYSIVTEYTSFLVLENDNEYKRWKIKRLNQSRVKRDRNAQNKLRDSLDEVRRMASSDLGPQEERKVEQVQQVAKNKAVPQQFTQQQQSRQPRNSSRRRRINISPGTGPIGLLFMGAVAWLNRKKKQIDK